MPVPTRAPRLPACHRLGLIAAIVLAGVGLAGCSDSGLQKFPPVCPEIRILSDGADMTRFRTTGTDLTDMMLDGRITQRPVGQCFLDDPTHLRTVISVIMEVTRGPAAAGREADVTYFLSASRGNDILDRRDYTVHVEFPRNTERLRLRGEQIELVFPVDAKTPGNSYTVHVGFQLTPEQLAFNRRRGVR